MNQPYINLKKDSLKEKYLKSFIKFLQIIFDCFYIQK